MQQQAREQHRRQGLLLPWMALQLLQQAVLLHSCEKLLDTFWGVLLQGQAAQQRPVYRTQHKTQET
jgi:hypothetical protein